MNRIIEAFTRAHDQVTGIDEIIMCGTALVIVAIGIISFFIIMVFIEEIRKK